MSKKKQEKVQLHYLEMPRESYVLYQLGEKMPGDCRRKTQELHFHNYLEIGYCSRGEGTLVFEKEEYFYFSQAFCIIPKNCPHSMIGDGQGDSTWEFLYVDVERFLTDMYPGRSRMVEEISRKINAEARFLTWECYYALGNLIQELIREIREKGEYYQECIKGYLLAFLLETARICAGGTQVQWNLENAAAYGEVSQIGNALRYVGKHYAEPIKVKDMAAACGLSETHFRRLFLEYNHISPADYVSRVRIRAACKLMLTTTASLDEIAMKAGFASMSTFNRNFKKILGTSPHSWRKDKNNQESPVYSYH
ncbi:MAG: AraC family transcriptional regulator [Lachnospiraceae bacterium]|nr:AraC family transcriptional regulator [Lachnospiraceae bacterium]